jgi:hypothetical protein
VRFMRRLPHFVRLPRSFVRELAPRGPADLS